MLAVSHSAKAIASQLYQARHTSTPIDFLTSALPGLTWEDARAIARESDVLRRVDGETQIGWKLGWTSSAMREALGVNRPNWGTLWNSQVADSSVARIDYIHPKAEPELVWRSTM